MIQALRSSLALRSPQSAPSAVIGSRLQPKDLSLNASIAPVDRLRLPQRSGQLPARGVQLFSTRSQPNSVMQSNATDPIETFMIQQIQKLNHIAPTLESLPDFKVTPLKIAIEKAQQTVAFSVRQATLQLTDLSGQPVRLDSISGDLSAHQRPDGIELRLEGNRLGIYRAPVQVLHEQEHLTINGSAFRGNLSLLPAAEGGFHVVNEVLLEDYLKSVVPSESPASWPQQSLQAQAMAARTYAVANWGKNKADGFDMNDDTSDQVYKGMATEHPATQEAVAATEGKIITHGNKPITALFFSTSGGHTDSAKEVWGVELPYIQPVPDFDQAASRYRWTLTRSASQLSQAMVELGHDVGSIRSIEAIDHTPHDRVKQLRVTGTRGTAIVNGNRFRFAAKLYSTKFKINASGGQFVFQGGGWGHALGMSQWGARQMAKDGYQAAEIIHHYYQGVEIQSLD